MSIIFFRPEFLSQAVTVMYLRYRNQKCYVYIIILYNNITTIGDIIIVPYHILRHSSLEKSTIHYLFFYSCNFIYT